MTPNSKSTARQERILVVDDDEDICLVLKRGLEKEGFVVDSIGEPSSVLANYEPGKYDLLLIDIKMPGMSGFELYRRIRKLDNKVKLCFITAFEIYYDEFRRVFPKIYVSCFIQKPITIKELSRIVREELARQYLEEEQPASLRPPHKESE